jgi:hypothetical protein
LKLKILPSVKSDDCFAHDSRSLITGKDGEIQYAEFVKFPAGSQDRVNCTVSICKDSVLSSYCDLKCASPCESGEGKFESAKCAWNCDNNGQDDCPEMTPEDESECKSSGADLIKIGPCKYCQKTFCSVAEVQDDDDTNDAQSYGDDSYIGSDSSYTD